jgi:hypothetical protein
MPISSNPFAIEHDKSWKQVRLPIMQRPSAALIASYGFLKLSPFWESLRDDPRFEQIVAFFGLKE